MPTTFVAAVRAKYEHEKGSADGGELVGGDKTGKKQALDVLARVFVPDSSVDSPGDEGEIARVCGAIKELDIGGNAFGSWEPVQAIVSQLPKLQYRDEHASFETPDHGCTIDTRLRRRSCAAT